MTDKGLIALVVATIAVLVSAFLVVWGAVNNQEGYVTAGFGLLASSTTYVITDYFRQKQIEALLKKGREK